MTPVTYRTILTSLSLNMRQAAKLLGVNEVTARRWGLVGVNGGYEILLQLLESGKIKPADLTAVRHRRTQ